jgi:hypothetical protein
VTVSGCYSRSVLFYVNGAVLLLFVQLNYNGSQLFVSARPRNVNCMTLLSLDIYAYCYIRLESQQLAAHTVVLLLVRGVGSRLEVSAQAQRLQVSSSIAHIPTYQNYLMQLCILTCITCGMCLM